MFPSIFRFRDGVFKLKEEKYNAEDVLEQVICIAYYEHDVAGFGRKVADVLYEQGYIDEAIYEVLVGK